MISPKTAPKGLAVLALVKEISVFPELINDKFMPVVTITYRFNEPPQLFSTPAVLKDHTPARAAITDFCISPTRGSRSARQGKSGLG